ncbi:Ig-like domain-containing protein [Moellerella wisconsensis]|uniref:Ig-like domain-containing protein n=1 Tax=Moellerella wisconsensis TaxID=158849 RepID=A0A9Q8Q438_9GAMM|nr:Ig-like domain-containing protein [Moellerella wisconsensis]UNH31781.1 Ig-like domain-containing protein [Moellerella wisconsensis]
MTSKNITIKINNNSETIKDYSFTAGFNGIGAKGQPLHIEAQKNVNYLLINNDTQYAPENIATKRIGDNLYIAFEGADIDAPDLIIDNYFAVDGEIDSAVNQTNLIIGQHENGKYYPYVPESTLENDAISQLAENHQAGQAIGGVELPPVWAFNPWWLAALLPLAAGGIALSKNGGSKKESIVQNPPDAQDDGASTQENTPVTIDILNNDSDKDGDLDPTSVTVVTPPSQGKVVIDPITGKATYTPNPGAHGEDTFTYTVKDTAGNISEPATVTVHISANPDAQDDGASTQENTPVAIDILNNDSDKDGDLDPTSVTIVKSPAQGTVAIDPISGKATYTPNPGAHGEDTFTYTVKDTAGNISQPATVTVHISANPDAQDDGASTQENTPVAIDVLGNDSDKDGDLDPTSVTVVTPPSQGKVVIDPITGKATYTPNPGAHGEDTFTYTVKDTAGNISEPATVTVHISANPDAQDDGASTQENTPVAIDILNNDSDKDGDLDPTSVTVVTPPSQGKVVIDPITGKATYTPNPGAHGEDTFTYTVKDKAGNISEPATVTVHISANPDAQDDGASTQENTPVAIDILGNDSDKDGDLDPTSVTVVTPPSQGKVVIDPITGKATYTPNPGAHGEDTFTYTVKDKAGNISEPATVTVHISANPDAQDDGASTQENTPVAIDILNNDSDKDGDLDPTSVTVVTPPSQGKVVIDPITGKATYTPNPGAHGEDTFTYTVKDTAGNISEPATVTVEISQTQISKVTVSESGLPDGSHTNTADTRADGEFIISNPDNKPVAELNIQLVKPENKLTSHGKDIIWEESPQELVGKTENGDTVVTIKLTESKANSGEISIKYQVELHDAIDHEKSTDEVRIDFSVQSETDIVKGEISIKDDAPLSEDISATVETGIENTFYANIIISLDFSSSMYASDSGIVENGVQITRYDAALDAMQSLLDNYQTRLESADSGDVRVSLNGFAKSAVALGGSSDHPADQPFWCTLTEAKAIIEGLRDGTLQPDWNDIGVDTNYDAALQQIVSIYNQDAFENRAPVTQNGVDNTFYFISDGIPNENNEGDYYSEYNGLGIQAESSSHYIPGASNVDIGEDKWKEFLEQNNIRAIAIGIGPDMDVDGKTYLKPIAYDGVKRLDNDGSDLIVLTDMSKLSDTLEQYIPNDRSVKSNFAQDEDGNNLISFGADGMGSTSIEVDGVTYTYNVQDHQFTLSHESDSANKWADLGQGLLHVNTNAGGELFISLGEKSYGEFTYKPGFKRPSDITEDKFTLILADKEGDTVQSLITIDLKNVKPLEAETVKFIADYNDINLLSTEPVMNFSRENDAREFDDSSYSYNNQSMFSQLDMLQVEQNPVI